MWKWNIGPVLLLAFFIVAVLSMIALAVVMPIINKSTQPDNGDATTATSGTSSTS